MDESILRSLCNTTLRYRYKVLICVFAVLLQFPDKTCTLNFQTSEVYSVKEWTASCEKRTSCMGRPIEETTLATIFLLNYSCYCDTICSKFKDCCPDYEQNDVSKIETFENLYQHYSCRHLPEADHYNDIYLITSCPRDWNDEHVRRSCEQDSLNDTFLNLPVTGVKSEANYKNLFCSICHGEGQGVLYWTAESCCLSKPQNHIKDWHLKHNEEWHLKHNEEWHHDHFGDGMTETPVVLENQCESIYRPPLLHSYRTCRRSIKNCRTGFSEETLDKKCSDGHATYIYTKNETYNNIFCALCNGIPMEEITCERRAKTHKGVCFGSGKRRKLPYSFKVLLDINTNRRMQSSRVGKSGTMVTTTNITRHLSCPAHQVYDPFSKRCRAVWCQTDAKISQHGECTIEIDLDFGENLANITEAVSGMECQWIKFNETEYQIVKNGSIFIPAYQKFYAPPRIRLFVSRHALVCVDFARNYTDTQLVNQTRITFNFSQTQVYLSLIGLVLSLVALAVQMIVYGLLPTLRNVPGKNLMNLVGALFVAELLFLVAPSFEAISSEGCQIVAVLMHFAFLAAFLWMHVMSLDIWYTFSRKSITTHRSGKSKRFRIYLTYAWTSAVVLVLVSVLVDNFTDKDFSLRPQYGQGICWLSNRDGLLLFFAAPISLIVISNIILYVFTVRNIIRVDKSTRIAHKNSDRRRFFLYVKLCFLMGVAWIFGFLAAFTDVQALWYLFVILNTLQGVFICVAFVCTRKVFRLLKGKCSYDAYPGMASQSRSTLSSSGEKSSVTTQATYVSLEKKGSSARL